MFRHACLDMRVVWDIFRRFRKTVNALVRETSAITLRFVIEKDERMKMLMDFPDVHVLKQNANIALK